MGIIKTKDINNGQILNMKILHNNKKKMNLSEGWDAHSHPQRPSIKGSLFPYQHPCCPNTINTIYNIIYL